MVRCSSGVEPSLARCSSGVEPSLARCSFSSLLSCLPKGWPRLLNPKTLFLRATTYVSWGPSATSIVAHKCIIDGVNIQDYLQSHYIAAVSHLAMRLREAGGLLDECVLGWDSLNEPFEGLCGLEDITVVPKHQQLKKGSNPTPFQSMCLAMGQEQTCEYWDFGSFGPKRNGSVTIDPEGVRLWVDPELADEDENGASPRWGWKRDPGWKLGSCIWALHGVWDPESGMCLRPDYFAHPRADPTRE